MFITKTRRTRRILENLRDLRDLRALRDTCTAGPASLLIHRVHDTSRAGPAWLRVPPPLCTGFPRSRRTPTAVSSAPNPLGFDTVAQPLTRRSARPECRAKNPCRRGRPSFDAPLRPPSMRTEHVSEVAP